MALCLVAISSARAQLTSQGSEVYVNYAPPTAIIAQNQPATNFNATTGLNTFIMAAPQGNAARVYITNETINACSGALTLSAATTGRIQTDSFNKFPQAWQTVPIISPVNGGYVSSSGTLTLPASGTVVITTSAISGINLALFLVNGTSGCGTTNIDVTVIFTPIALTSPLIDVVASSNIQPGINQLTNGIDVTSAGQPARPVDVIPHASLGFSLDGMPIGGNTLSNPGTFTQVREPAGNIDGPLMVALNAAAYVNCGPTSTGACLAKSNPAAGNAGTGGIAPTGGLFVADSGFIIGQSATITTSGQVLNLWNNYNLSSTANGVIQTCHFTVVTGAPGGTTPTLNVYIQDSDDNSHWDDRVSFTQFTTATAQTAGIAGGSANQAVAVVQSHTLAAGTINSGPLGEFGQVYFVVGGTSPSWPVAVYANCK